MGKKAIAVVKSVVGSIRISASDPGLTGADAVIRGLFSRSEARRRPRRFRAARPRARRD